jgi:hypothetical protein
MQPKQTMLSNHRSKKTMRLFILIVSTLALTGCAGGHRDLKSPCGPSASLSANPCAHIPLNVASADNQEDKIS